MRRETVTYELIDELLRFLPMFDDPDRTFIERWGGGERTSDGVITLPYPVYPHEVKEFFRLASQPCWCDDEYEPRLAGRMLADDRAISTASLDQVRAMLAYCVRGERFCDGHWRAVLESGRVVALLKRLRELRESMGIANLNSIGAGSNGAKFSHDYVQSCISAIGFPDNLDSLISMADGHREDCGCWITDLESLLREDGVGSDEDEPGYWTGARWMTEGDILFFYQTRFRPRLFVRRLLKQARTLPVENAKPLVELLERNLKLIDRYGGTIFACAEVTGPSEYLQREDGERNASHFRGRVFVPNHRVHVFEVPLGGEHLKQQVTLSTGGTITPLLGEDFEGVKQALAKNNVLPEYLLKSKPGGRSFSGISKATWREISCAPELRFIDESQIRVYLLDYLLDEVKDHGTPLLQECECFRDGQRTGRADYFIQVGKQWVAVEAKLNVLCERDLLGQISKYTSIKLFQPEKGRYRGRKYELTSSALCLVADQVGLYLIDEGHFVLGEPGSPAWLREELTLCVVMDIREAIISRLAFRND